MLAIGSLGQGGSEKQLTEFAVRLPAGRFDSVLVTNLDSAHSDHEARIRAAAVGIHSIRFGHGNALRRWLTTARAYAEAVRAVRPDIVYAWLDETAAFLAPVCRTLRVPCLVARRNIIGSNLERRYPTVGRWLRVAERQALLVTANSGAVARECVARGHRADRVRVVPNGHECVAPLPAPAGPVTFGCVAQFRPEKGHHRLIDALELVPDGDWGVDLAGDGPLRSEIEARVSRAGLGDRVRFLGPVTDVREFWRERHVALLLSDSEGMPNALLEASFAGRPAIGTDSGGTPEVVGDAGVIVSLSDSAATAAALVRMAADDERRKRLGEIAWHQVADRYSMERMVSGHVSAIEETLELAGSRTRRAPRGGR
jgi:glycosyltransferase involved in cell wall biosynthesis